MKTVSLELAIELKKTGYKQNEGIRWYNKYFGRFPEMFGKYGYTNWNLLDYQKGGSEWETVLAPTADEILEKLPPFVQFEKHSLPFSLRITKDMQTTEINEYSVFYVRHRKIITAELDYQERGRSTEESLADAAAKMWLYLRKNNLLS